MQTLIERSAVRDVCRTHQCWWWPSDPERRGSKGRRLLSYTRETYKKSTSLIDVPTFVFQPCLPSSLWRLCPWQPFPGSLRYCFFSTGTTLSAFATTIRQLVKNLIISLVSTVPQTTYHVLSYFHCITDKISNNNFLKLSKTRINCSEELSFLFPLAVIIIFLKL